MANENKTYYAKAASNTRSFNYKDIFGNVFAKHTKADMDKVFSAGLEGHVPEPGQMLNDWQKPWLFSRVLLFGVAAWILVSVFTAFQVDYILLGATFIVPAIVVPFVVVTFFWEMNIPRNIAIYDVIKFIVFGGIISAVVCSIINALLNTDSISSEILSNFSVGVTEELTKLIIVAVILRKADRCWGLNGLLIGAAVGCGFALFETNGYGIDAFIQSFYKLLQDYGDSYSYVELMKLAMQTSMSSLISRGVLAICGHVAFSAMYGGALALAKGKQKINARHFIDPTFMIAFVSSVLIHGFFDYLWSDEMANFLFHHSATAGLASLLYGNSIVSDIILLLIFGTVEYAIILWLLRRSVRQVVLVAGGGISQPVNQVGAVQNAPQKAPAYADIPVQPGLPHDPPQQVLRLKCVSGVLAGQTYTIEKGRTVQLGRGAHNAICYPNDTKGISRVHCSITFDGTNAIVTDLGSSVGTFFADGRKFQPQMKNHMKNGETFYLGAPNNTFQISIQ